MEGSERSGPRFVTAGNALTAARLVLLPVVIAGIALHIGYLAVGAMAAALLTDLLDGRISRRLGQASPFGADLDSTIDFVLLYSLFIALYAAGRLPTYQFCIIYIAMVANLLLQFGTMAKGAMTSVARIKTGKLTGALEYFYLLFLVVSQVLPRSRPVSVIGTVIFALLAVAIVANAVPVVARLRAMR